VLRPYVFVEPVRRQVVCAAATSAAAAAAAACAPPPLPPTPGPPAPPVGPQPQQQEPQPQPQPQQEQQQLVVCGGGGVPRRTPPQEPELPTSLRSLGNTKAWTNVLDHFRRARHDQVVIWGPTGCGKTCGVRDIARALGLEVVEIDGAAADTTSQLMEWVVRIRDVKLMQGNSLLFLDDFESFTVEARSRLVEWMRRCVGNARLCPMVVTCTNVREHRPLESFASFKLVAPDSHTCRLWFERHGVRASGGGGGVCVPPHAWISQVQWCVGDIRRMRIALEWRTVMEAAAQPVAASFHNAFESTRRLFLKQATAAEWARHATRSDLDLVREHAIKYVRSVDDVAELYDILSATASSVPQDYANWTLHDMYSLTTAAAAVHVHVRTREVGALVPCTMLSSRDTMSKKRKGGKKRFDDV
jgi:hypothetical protein